MFDSVLGRGSTPKSRFGTGTIVSVGLHVGLILLFVWMSLHPHHKDEGPIADVKFVAAPPPPPPPPPASHHSTHKKVVHHDKIVQPKVIPKEKPPEEDPPKDEEDDGVEGGVLGGVKGGVIGGVVGGTGTAAVPFGEGMTRPSQVAGPPAPEYTREAREAHVEGLLIVRCTITTEGTLSDCKIIKPLPFMEGNIMNWLHDIKFTPVMFHGQPQTVSYTFDFHLKMR